MEYIDRLPGLARLSLSSALSVQNGALIEFSKCHLSVGVQVGFWAFVSAHEIPLLMETLLFSLDPLVI
jgi:hypothetical protein